MRDEEALDFATFIPRRDLDFMYRACCWESLTEMIRYIDIEDIHKSYALLGFTAFGTNELAFSIVEIFLYSLPFTSSTN